MGKHIPKSSHLVPGNFLVRKFDLFGNAGGGFSKVQEIQFQAFLLIDRVKELSFVHAVKDFDATAREGKHVVDSVAVPHHIATLSFMTWRVKRLSRPRTNESTTSTLRPRIPERDS